MFRQLLQNAVLPKPPYSAGIRNNYDQIQDSVAKIKTHPQMEGVTHVPDNSDP